MSEIFSKILKDKNGKVLNVGSKYTQPEWGAETAIMDILPEAQYTASEETEGMAVVTQLVPLVAEQVYTVTYNGVEYNVSAKPIDEDGVVTSFALGNMVIEGGEDTGEPFLCIVAANDEISSSMGFYGAIVPLDGAETFTFSIKGEGEVIHTIPTKYTGSTMRVTVSHDKTADKTFEEIEAAIENGAIVQVFFDAVGNLSENGYTVYTLSQFIKGAGIFFYNGSLRQILTIASDGTINVGMAD